MNLSIDAQSWFNLILVWLGFGTLVGLIARAFLPGGAPKTLLGVLAVGMAGSCIGPFFYIVAFRPERFQPISPLGFGISTLTALFFLLLFRVGAAFMKKSDE